MCGIVGALTLAPSAYARPRRVNPPFIVMCVAVIILWNTVISAAPSTNCVARLSRISRYCAGQNRGASNRRISTEFAEGAASMAMVLTRESSHKSGGVLKETHATGTGRQRRR
jgi:hypothetical protein